MVDDNPPCGGRTQGAGWRPRADEVDLRRLLRSVPWCGAATQRARRRFVLERADEARRLLAAAALCDDADELVGLVVTASGALDKAVAEILRASLT